MADKICEILQTFPEVSVESLEILLSDFGRIADTVRRGNEYQR